MNKPPAARTLFGLLTVASFLTAFVFISCDQPFDPRGELDQKPVVFSVLSTDRDLQFVRVERSYMPAGYDPLTYTADNSVANAAVTISNGGMTMRLTDTILARSDTSRFKFPLRAYIISPFRPMYGVSYTVRVESPQLGVATATARMPTRPFFSIDASSFAVLDRPVESDSLAQIIFSVSLGEGAIGYLGRFFIDYDVLKEGEWVEERVEVPTGFTYSGIRNYDWVTYGQLKHRTATNKAAGVYTNRFYTHAFVDAAYKKHASSKIIFNRVVFQLLQIDQNFYNYYMVTHSYQDPHSLRLDEPIFSNAAGGIGMVGSYTLDSVTHALPENFVSNRR